MRMIARSFVTGSRAYGSPGFFSDLDIVCMMNMEDIDRIAHIRGVKVTGRSEGMVSLKMGKVHLIACYDGRVYSVWDDGTRAMKARKDEEGPFSSEAAAAIFNAFRRFAGLPPSVGEAGEHSY